MSTQGPPQELREKLQIPRGQVFEKGDCCVRSSETRRGIMVETSRSRLDSHWMGSTPVGSVHVHVHEWY